MAQTAPAVCHESAWTRVRRPSKWTSRYLRIMSSSSRRGMEPNKY
ncbi:MAG: hypothetical protein ACAI25_10110 [Planctomycetota bacterium]